MAFPSPFKSLAEVSSTSVEQSLRMIETVQETLIQKRRQLEDIQTRQQSLIQELEQLDATATDLGQRVAGIMQDLEPDSSAPVDLGEAGLSKDRKAKWKSAAILKGKSSKARDAQIA